MLPRRVPTFALLTAGAGLMVGVAVLVLVANNIGSGDGTPRDRPSASLFQVGQASALADTVRREGPLLLADPVGRSRDIYVQHVGEDGWRAFEARLPGTPRNCTLRWQAASRTFVDPCDARAYPADGTGLTTFPARVDEEGRLIVDLRSPTAPATTVPLASPPATTPPEAAVTTAGA